ncbi:MAG: VanZ family protein [Longimicrobiales bacterium]
MGIYSTIGLARTLGGMIGPEVTAAVFGFGMLLVGAALLTQGLRVRPGGAEIGVALGVVAVYLMVVVRMLVPEHRSHLIEYTVVALFMYEALSERKNQGRQVPAPAVLAVVGTSLVGVIDEFIQAFLPSRVFDPADMLFNFLAAVMAVAASAALGWARRRWPGRHQDRVTDAPTP